MKKKRWSLLVVSVVLLLYTGTYAMLSGRGQYVLSQSGKLRYSSVGLSVSDLSEWRPSGCWFQAGFTDVGGKKTCRGNALGYLFAPLIAIDQKWIHKAEVVNIREQSP